MGRRDLRGSIILRPSGWPDNRLREGQAALAAREYNLCKSSQEAPMLFFVKARLPDVPPVARELYLGMVVSTWEVIKQLENDGKVLAGGALIGQRSGIVIADVASNEELSEMLNRLPLSAYLEWEVVPLVPAERALEDAKWTLQHGPGQQRR